MKDFENQRTDMVVFQIQKRGITDERVLYALRTVPRHLFVPASQVAHAYDDMPLSIGHGQTISQPYMVALMTALLDLQPDQTVLEIGTGSGYQTAILALLGKRVVSIETIRVLADDAATRLKSQGYTTVDFFCGDGTLGLSSHAPYDRILVTAGAPHVPSALLAQLAPEGRLVLPVGDRASQTLTVVRKENENIRQSFFGQCVFVPLVGKQGW